MTRWFAPLVACIALCFAGCGGGGGGINLPDPTVRVLNASPDSVALEFLFDGDVHVASFAYLVASAGFISFEPEIIDVALREAGTTMELWAEVVNFTADNHFLLVAVGLENFGTEFEKRLRLLNINVDRSVPAGNKARVYVAHAYHRAVGFQTPNIDFQTPGNNPQFKLEDIEFATSKNFVVDSGTFTWEARVAGTTNILVSQSATLGAGKVYVAVFSGIEGAAAPQDPRITFFEMPTE